MDEIQMRNKIDFDNLIYNFKGPTSSKKFGKFGGPIYIYGHMKNGDITLQQAEKQQNDFGKELNEITSGNSKHKSNSQLYIIKSVKNFITQDKKLLIYLMIIQEVDLKPFTDQNKMKLREKDLKY